MEDPLLRSDSNKWKKLKLFLFKRLYLPLRSVFWRDVYIFTKHKKNRTIHAINLVCVGKACVGKSSLIRRFLQPSSPIPQQYKRTVEDFHTCSFPYNDAIYDVISANLRLQVICDVSMLDTSGTYRFPAMRRKAIQECDVIMMVYSQDDESSLRYLESLYTEIAAARPLNIPLVIVGNKTESTCLDAKSSLGAWTNDAYFLESSARDNWNVGLVFTVAFGAVIAQRRKIAACSTKHLRRR